MTGDRGDRNDRVIAATPASTHEEAFERALRPKLLDEYVGRPSRLYDGSWSEWGGRADTPVQTG